MLARVPGKHVSRVPAFILAWSNASIPTALREGLASFILHDVSLSYQVVPRLATFGPRQMQVVPHPGTGPIRMQYEHL